MNAEYATIISWILILDMDSVLTACKDRKINEYTWVPASGVESRIPEPSSRFALYPQKDCTQRLCQDTAGGKCIKEHLMRDRRVQQPDQEARDSHFGHRYGDNTRYIRYNSKSDGFRRLRQAQIVWMSTSSSSYIRCSKARICDTY